MVKGLLILLFVCSVHSGGSFGTWLPNYGDEKTNLISNATIARNTFTNLRDIGATHVYIDVWHNGMTGFPSVTWASATGTKWSGVDYLSFPVELAKECGLQVYAWFEYGLMTGGPLQKAQPSWILGNLNGNTWLDPSNPNVQKFIIGIIVDAINHQPSLDGIQLDDHFAWPYALGNAPDKINTMTELMKKIFYAVKSASNNSVMVSLAPNPIDISTDDFNVPWNVWLDMGFIEDSVPQLYTTDVKLFKQKFDEQVASLSSSNGKNRLKAGILLNDGNTPTPWDSVSQMMLYEIKQGWSGQVLWYGRGILEFYLEQVASIWNTTNVVKI